MQKEESIRMQAQQNLIKSLHEQISRHYYKPEPLESLSLEEFITAEQYLKSVSRLLNDPHFRFVVNKVLTYELPYGHINDHNNLYIRLPSTNKPNRKTLWEGYIMTLDHFFRKAASVDRVVLDLRDTESLPPMVMLYVCKVFGIQGMLQCYTDRFDEFLSPAEPLRQEFEIGPEKLRAIDIYYRPPVSGWELKPTIILSSHGTRGFAELLVFALQKHKGVPVYGGESANKPGRSAFVVVDQYSLIFRATRCLVFGELFTLPQITGPINKQML
jgi:hypothetical protein